jgi:hypothetical protein
MSYAVQDTCMSLSYADEDKCISGSAPAWRRRLACSLTQGKESTTQCCYVYYTKSLYSLHKVIGDTCALQATMV